jgi:hypothetical protein
MTDFGANVISVLPGNGDGTFQAPVMYPVGRGPISVAAADVNGDGIADLAVANYASGTLSVLLGNADGTYQPAATYRDPDPAPLGVAVADVNGDGIPDVLVLNAIPPGPCRLWTFLGQGDGTFQLDTVDPPDTCPQPPLPHPPIPWVSAVPIVLGDFNHDGTVDVALVDYANNSSWIGFNHSSEGSGRARFGDVVVHRLLDSTSPVFLAAGDFNGDGLLDLAVATSQNNAVSILLNQEPPGSVWPGLPGQPDRDWDWAAWLRPVPLVAGDGIALQGPPVPFLAAAPAANALLAPVAPALREPESAQRFPAVAAREEHRTRWAKVLIVATPAAADVIDPVRLLRAFCPFKTLRMGQVGITTSGRASCSAKAVFMSCPPGTGFGN